jgi:hypothetical protein
MKIYFTGCHPFTGAALTSINVKVYGISPFFISPTKLALTTGIMRMRGGGEIANPTDVLQHVTQF